MIYGYKHDLIFGPQRHLWIIVTRAQYAVSLLPLLKFSIIEQGSNQHNKTGTCVVYKRPGGGIQYLQKRQHNGSKIDAHRQCNAELNRGNRRIGQPFQIRDFGKIITHQCNIGSVDCDITSHIAHTLEDGDWREIEFIGEPITTKASTGWDMNGNDVFEDVTLTSLKLRGFGGSFTSTWEDGGLDLADYRGGKFPTVVLKDGTEIQLNGSLGFYDSKDYGTMIPLDEVDHLVLMDGTVLYPVTE